MRVVVWLFLFCAMSPAFAGMNGYELAQFGDFEHEWKLVTVRYRQDTGELRFTYANESAWKVLNQGSIEYPDGAVFAKIGVQTRPDPSFPSSVVPSGARRIQFMVRNLKKHKADDGWGYALFDPEGKTFPGDLRAQVQACVACHRLVPERGQVFSQLMSRPLADKGAAALFRFEDLQSGKLPAKVRGFLSGGKSVRSLHGGTLNDKPFFGTLDEVQPLLAAEVLRSGQPAVLLGKNGGDFSLVRLAKASDECAKGKALEGIHTVQGKGRLYQKTFCMPAH